MTGAHLRMNRLFNGSDHTVIVAVDHGMFDGPVPGFENMALLEQKINPGIDGVLLSPGMMKNMSGLFGRRNAPLAILRINWSSVYCFHWKYTGAYTVASGNIKQAIQKGADAVLISLTLHTGSEALDAQNIELYSRLSSEAMEYGLPVIGEYFPQHAEDLGSEDLHEQVYAGCRIISELGADMIKTFYTHRFNTISSNIATPILGLGASKKNTQLEALRLASDEIKAGAAGVVFGRNAIQVRKPVQFQAALLEVVKNDMDPVFAAEKFKLKDV